METIILNWEEYVKKSDISSIVTNTEGMVYSMVRTYSAWVFAWYLESRNWKEVVLRNARRIFYWDGAASLSQLATDWTSKPENCKFPCAVDKVELMEVIEIIPITEKAKVSINSVSIWQQ